MPAGSLVGALAAMALGDRFGRKKAIILAGMIWVIGCILQAASVVSSTLKLPSVHILTASSEPWHARGRTYHRGHLCWYLLGRGPYVPV